MDALLERERRQRVLDTAAVLQGHRRRAVAELRRGRDVDPTRSDLVGARSGAAAWLLSDSWRWRHVLSTRDVTTAAGLAASMPNNRRILGGGLQMTSVFDHAQTDTGARAMLEAEPSGVYFYGFAPLWVRMVNHGTVYMLGPCSDGDTILRMSSPAVHDAAREYWHAVRATLRPCAPAPRRFGLTQRQHQVVDLLRHDLSDERIAQSLQVSVRTVRYEVAEVLRLLDVRSRFAAGYAYAELLAGENEAPPR